MAKKANKALKNSPASEARAKIEAQMRAQERRTTVIIWAIVVFAVAAFAGIVYFIATQGQDTVEPELATAEYGFAVGTGGAVGQDVPADALEVAVYADYMCGACQRFEQVNSDVLDEYREQGLIAVTYHPIAILDRPGTDRYSTRSANAAITVAEMAPEYFLEYTHLLFARQPGEVNPIWSTAQLADMAREVGVPEDVARRIADGVYRNWVAEATNASSIAGVRSTPTLMVDGVVIEQEEVGYMTPGVLDDYLRDRLGAQ